MNRFIYSFFCFLLFSLPILAQPNGNLTGQVTDATRSVLPGTKMSLKNIATGTEQATKTDNAGRYQFTNLTPGLYHVRAEQTGFSPVMRSLTLTKDERSEVNFELAPAGISEQVTVTAARGERDLLETNVRTETVNQETILRQNITGAQDSLINLPNITPVGNGPFQQRPKLRGLDSTRILVLIDGDRLNTTRVATDRAGPEIGLVAPDSIQSIEVVRGSGSVLYGTDALSGTINIITDQPQRSDSGFRFGASLNSFYSTNENGRRGTAKVDLSNSKFALRLSGELERFGNYHAGAPFAETNQFLLQEGRLRQTLYSRIFPDPFNAPYSRTTSEIFNSQSHGNNINAVGRFFPTDSDSLRISWIRRRNRNIGFPDFQAPIFFQVISLPFSDLDKYNVRYERNNLTPWFTGFSVKAYHQQQDRNLRNDFSVYSSAPPRPGQQPLDSIVEVKLLTDTRQNVKSYGWDVQTNFLLSSRNLLTAGASWFYDHSRDSRTSRSDAGIIGFATRPPAPPRFISVPRIPFGPPSTTFPQRVPVSNFKNLGLFLQDEYEVKRWLRFTGGLRIDRFDINTENTPGYLPLTGIADATPTVDVSKLPRATGENFNRSRVSGDVGVVIRPTDSLSFSARVGRSLRHPNLEELLFSGPATIGNIIPNIKVQPETGINVDVGARVRTARYAASVSYFNNTYNNFISTELVSISQSVGPLLQAINFAKVRISGFELDLERPFAAGNSTITPILAVGYLRGTVLESVNPLNNASLNNTPLNKIAPLKAVTGLRWQDKVGRWWSEYNVRAHAKVSRISPLLTGSPFVTAQDYFGLAGFNVHTVRGGYNFQRERGRIALTLGLENFTNQYYREQFQFAPARGRSFTVGLLLKYF